MQYEKFNYKNIFQYQISLLELFEWNKQINFQKLS